MADMIGMDNLVYKYVSDANSSVTVDADYITVDRIVTDSQGVRVVAYKKEEVDMAQIKVNKEFERKLLLEELIPDVVWFNPPYTTVAMSDYGEWGANRKITVKRDRRDFDEFGEFCRAITKHPNFVKLLPPVMSVQYNSADTKVIFQDMSEVTVTASDYHTMTPECGLAIALCKKVIGSTSDLIRCLERAKKRANARKDRREFWKEEQRIEKEKLREQRRKRVEYDIQIRLYNMQIEAAARKMLREKEPELYEELYSTVKKPTKRVAK